MNTKNIFKTGLLTLALGLSLSSCLNLDPKDSLADNLVWDKADNFQLFANQFYSWTRDFGGYSANYQNALSDGVHSDYRSDLVCATSQNVYSMGTNTIPSTDANYTTLYKRIYYTNLLLSNVGDRTDVNQPKGEALWFRAYLHFELVQIYGDCQLLTEPLDIDNNQLYGKRNNRSEVIDQCLTDLTQAAELLPETPSEDGRLCKCAARALASRIALYEGTWQKYHGGESSRYNELLIEAQANAQYVMDNGGYSLFYDAALVNSGINDINQSYRYMFILEDADCNPAKLQKKANKEYILAHRHRMTDKLAVNITHGYLGNASIVTRKMANMFVCTDGLPISVSPLWKAGKQYAEAASEFQNRDPRMDNDMLWHGENHWNNDSKWRTTWNNDDLNSCLTANVRSNSGYQNQKWASERNFADYYESYDFPVIRYAEVLLNYAEATYEHDGKISDEDLNKTINLLRKRAGFAESAYLTNELVTKNSLNMLEEIRRERTVELYLEGFRIDDLKRWKTADKEMPEDQLGVKMTGTWFGTNWSAQSRSLNSDGCIIMYNGRTWADKNYLYPLPSDQLQLNPNLTQNDGWK